MVHLVYIYTRVEQDGYVPIVSIPHAYLQTRQGSIEKSIIGQISHTSFTLRHALLVCVTFQWTAQGESNVEINYEI
jgi:hypothetical protein